jgi:hypothetical protein
VHIDPPVRDYHLVQHDAQELLFVLEGKLLQMTRDQSGKFFQIIPRIAFMPLLGSHLLQKLLLSKERAEL